ncbi:MAG: hypothetical protein GIKADHBN_01190 [Phycisphaerales bacterium]|nr:hypothetical protein [Phycisphaerales bacterium]
MTPKSVWHGAGNFQDPQVGAAPDASCWFRSPVSRARHRKSMCGWRTTFQRLRRWQPTPPAFSGRTRQQRLGGVHGVRDLSCPKHRSPVSRARRRKSMCGWRTAFQRLRRLQPTPARFQRANKATTAGGGAWCSRLELPETALARFTGEAPEIHVWLADDFPAAAPLATNAARFQRAMALGRAARGAVSRPWEQPNGRGTVNCTGVFVSLC